MDDDDPVERPTADVPPPSIEDQAAEATEPDRPPEPSPDRGDCAPFWDLDKASFVVQVIGVVVAVIGVASALIFGLHVLRSGSSIGASAGSTSKSTSTATSHRTSEFQPPIPQPLTSDSSCSDFTSMGAPAAGHRVLVGSLGQFAEGASTVELRLMPAGRYAEVIRAAPGDVIKVSTALGDVAYGAASDVSVKADISADRGRCWRLALAVREPTSPARETELGPAILLLKHGGPAMLEYVPGTTELTDEQGRVLGGGLPDGVARHWIPLPYVVPGGTTYYLAFDVRVGHRQRHLSQSS